MYNLSYWSVRSLPNLWTPYFGNERTVFFLQLDTGGPRSTDMRTLRHTVFEVFAVRWKIIPIWEAKNGPLENFLTPHLETPKDIATKKGEDTSGTQLYQHANIHAVLGSGGQGSESQEPELALEAWRRHHFATLESSRFFYSFCFIFPFLLYFWTTALVWLYSVAISI